jgi:lysophospholipase L1-like esterase
MTTVVLTSCTASTTVPDPERYTVSYTPTCSPPRDCRQLLVIGDSVARGETGIRWQDLLADRLAGDPSQVTLRRYDGSRARAAAGLVTQWDFARVAFSAPRFTDEPGYLPDPNRIGKLDVLVVELGANDQTFDVDPAAFAVSLRTIVTTFPATQCVIIGHWERASVADGEMKPAHTAAEYRAQGAQVASETGCGFLDLSLLEPDGVAAEPLSPDGQHLTEEGHALVANLLAGMLGLT